MPSLSQRYRPKRFSEITGQAHVTETLRKEVASGILGHAYLFCGPRGVGKTTAARVFAKALNCGHPDSGEPCNACASCAAMNEGRWLDLIELDAATHTGVETVREAIIEHARFAPSGGRRKVYILDEAHMLSASSWNALLKTLEEPPSYAFFILATTEWHKVPATIVSRCQRFEFRRIADEELGARVRELAKQEGWKIEKGVVDLIVARAEGCVRDAETLLGQIGALGETDLTEAVAEIVLPPSRLPLAAGLVSLWADRDHSGALASATRLYEQGVPILPLFDDLLTVVRRLLAATGGAEEKDPSIQPLVGRFAPSELADLALLLLERRRDVKFGVDPLFALELASTAAACGLLKHSTNDTQPAPRIEQPATRRAEQATTANKDVLVPPISLPADLPISPDIASIRAKWNAFIRAVDEENHSLPFILKISQPESVDGDRLTVRFQYPFHRDKILSDAKHRRVVEECARAVFQCETLTFDGVVGEDPERRETRSTDMVTNILKAFGGSVVDG